MARRPTRAQVRERASAGVSPVEIEHNRRLLLAAAAAGAVTALDDAATAVDAVEAAPDLATAQAAVSGLSATLGSARDALDTQLA